MPILTLWPWRIEQGVLAFWEDAVKEGLASFRRVSCLINLPGHINRIDPQLNGLVDRYYAYAYAQVLLLDHPVFPDASGKLVFLPDGYQLRGEIPR